LAFLFTDDATIWRSLALGVLGSARSANIEGHQSTSFRFERLAQDTMSLVFEDAMIL